MDYKEFREIVRLAGNYVERLIDDGTSHLAMRGDVIGGDGKEAETRSIAVDAVRVLGELREAVSRCRKCALSKTRIKTVFGGGASRAPLILVGEAPGAEEDRQGLPFVGRAGQLLTKMLAYIGLKREDVYITNVLKCRPPNNRDPLPAEVACCEPYLLKQLEVLKPHLICALGRHAAQTLLKTDRGINSLRGRFYDYHGIKILPTYHPAYLLRNPAGKDKAKEDLRKIKEFLDGQS
ncbi:MAG: uracil-DNA glycosylase [bacterium]|jgi:DNA polymerase